VYVNGVDVNLQRKDAAFPAATCTDGDRTACEYKDKRDSDSCDALNDDFKTAFGHSGANVGLKCEETTLGLCVTVPLLDTDGKDAQIIFAIKDRDGCEDDDTESEGWRWSDQGDDSCGYCSGPKSACIWEDITSCTFAATASKKTAKNVLAPPVTAKRANSIQAEEAAKAIRIEDLARTTPRLPWGV
jgi:hypothetical protein